MGQQPLYKKASILLTLLFVIAILTSSQGCDDECDGADCDPTPTLIYSVNNLTPDSIRMTFYLNDQLIEGGQETFSIPSETKLTIFDVQSFQAGGLLTFVPAETDSREGTYDSLAITTVADRTVLTYNECSVSINALCIENYQVADSGNIVEYTLIVD